MADFCYQCSIETLGFDSKDLSGLCEEWEITGALCEGCGFISVDHEGKCIAISCEKHYKDTA